MVASTSTRSEPSTSGGFDISAWLGIDVGGSKLVFALADASGRVLARERRPTRPSGNGERDLARLLDDVQRFAAGAGAAAAELRAVGVRHQARKTARRERCSRLPICRAGPRCRCATRWPRPWGLPVFLENDANAAALAEWRFGAGRGCRDLVYLTMSTGIGAGLVLDGRLHAGFDGDAGEVGHLPLVWDGEPCACGLRGCFEAYAGGAAWQRRIRAEAPASGRVAVLAGGREAAGPEQVIAAAGEGDPWALAELARYNDFLARGLVVLVQSLAPERVVLGTIPSAAGEALCLGPVREAVRARVWPRLAAKVEILPSALGERLPELAGLCVALEATGEG